MLISYTPCGNYRNEEINIGTIFMPELQTLFKFHQFPMNVFFYSWIQVHLAPFIFNNSAQIKRDIQADLILLCFPLLYFTDSVFFTH